MALKMQTYDEPTDTWIDVVSVTQQVISSGSSGAAIVCTETLSVQDGVLYEDSLLHEIGLDYELVTPTINTVNPLAKLVPSYT